MNVREVNGRELMLTLATIVWPVLVIMADVIVALPVAVLVLAALTVLMFDLDHRPPSAWWYARYVIMFATVVIAIWRAVQFIGPEIAEAAYYLGDTAWVLPQWLYTGIAVLGVALGVVIIIAIIIALAWLYAGIAQKVANGFRRACRRKR